MMQPCPICGQAGATCGGPSHARPIDELIVLESTMADNDMEMVKVHVDDGTTRGHDRMFTRKDAERFIGYTPSAKIVDDDAPAEDEDAETKMVESAPSNKSRSRASAEDK